MKRSILLSLLILLLMSTPVHAYQPVNQHGCDAEHLSEIASTTTALDYTAACATYMNCVGAGVNSALCQMHVVLLLESECEDRLCEIRARLYTATITLYEISFMSFEYENADQTVREAVPVMLTAFEQGDYAAALQAYLDIPPDNYQHSMLYLSIGLLHEARGDTEAALTAYDQGWRVFFPQPLFYYVRGNLYEHLERATEATIDFQNLAYYLPLDPTLNDYAAELLAQYPLDDFVFEEWIQYPVFYTAMNPGGRYYADLSLQTPGTPLQLAMINDLLVTLHPGNPVNTDNPFPLLAKYKQTGSYQYQFYLAYDRYYGQTVTIDFSTQPAALKSENVVFDAYDAEDFMLTPAGEPDPRLLLPGTRCPGVARSRLMIGGHAVVTSSFPALPFYDRPDGTQIGSLPVGYEIGFTVLDGPVCTSDAAWWQILGDDGKLTGWIRESNGNKYLVSPDDSPPPTCEGSLPPRLAGGGSGQVIPDQGANRLRSNRTAGGRVS